MFSLLFLGSGCRIWYTDAVRVEYTAPPVAPTASLDPELGATDVNSLQFFVSERVTLERVVSSRDDQVARGHIRIRRGRLVERVVIRAGTPGIVTDWGDDWVDVSFEKGSAFRFRLTPLASVDEEGEGARRDDRYLLETEREGSAPTLEYAGRSYDVVNGRSAGLMVKQRIQKRHKWQRKVLRGRRL